MSENEKVIPTEHDVRRYAAMNLLLKRYGKDHVEAMDIRGIEESGHLRANIDDQWQNVRIDLKELAEEEEKLRKSEWTK